MDKSETILNLFKQYERKEVRAIFDPLNNSPNGLSIWDRTGVVKIPRRAKDFVFFVTYGREQSGHVFDEEVTDEGVLTWQSQPKKKLAYNSIQTLINHDCVTENIYLFLRTSDKNPFTKKKEPYTYMGKLAYITHDNEREAPVYFKWQLLNWPEISSEILERMRLKPTSTLKPIEGESGVLHETDPPLINEEIKGETTAKFRAVHRGIFTDYDKKRKIGELGELLALKWFKENLMTAGRIDLARKTVHVSKEIGDGEGYDIKTFDPNGNVLHVEVKTTTGSKHTPFYIYTNEVSYSEKNPESYLLLRIHNYDEQNNKGHGYILKGDINNHRKLITHSYKAYIREKRDTMVLKRGALSEYNTANSPWIIVAQSGKVDVGLEQKGGRKVGLSQQGMFNLVDEWLSSNTGMTKEQKQQLINKLQN